MTPTEPVSGGAALIAAPKQNSLQRTNHRVWRAVKWALHKTFVSCGQIDAWDEEDAAPGWIIIVPLGILCSPVLLLSFIVSQSARGIGLAAPRVHRFLFGEVAGDE